MYLILKKERLTETLIRMEIEAPLAARRALAGQFVILRANEKGERVPLTIADSDKNSGTVTVIFQVVGGATIALSSLEEGEGVADLVGPLGLPTEVEGLKKVAVIGGGVGCAIAYPVAKRLFGLGAEVTSVIGFRTKGMAILEREFEEVSSRLFFTTDDGSMGERGNVCLPLKRMLEAGENFDTVFTVGPLPMMKYVAEATRPYHIKTVASMNPIMIDGTGMCGCCRLTVGGKTKFACVDGPDFDAHLIDFDEAMGRLRTYSDFERAARERSCNLYHMEVK